MLHNRPSLKPMLAFTSALLLAPVLIVTLAFPTILSQARAQPPAASQVDQGTSPAQKRVAADVAGSQETDTDDHSNLASPQVVAWLQQLIRDNLPETYEDAKKWDLQKEVWDGVDVSRDGLKIKTKRKHKLVNHGTWTRYRLQIVEPEKNLNIQFHKLEVGEDGKVFFDVSVEMLLDVFGRLSQWVRDVQVISLSANADALCKLSIRGTVGFHLNPLRFPPDIRIKPHVDAARVDISSFRVRRISQLGGSLAEQLGNGLRNALEKKLEESNEKLPDKMNRQLEKHSDRMQFSTQDWLQSKLPLPKT
ncbi:MAG: hypothetical protein IT423_23325 [Pirellulaceae bacterium]|nr:hypothetical protein [Pirellulaceae bacterium]